MIQRVTTSNNYKSYNREQNELITNNHTQKISFKGGEKLYEFSPMYYFVNKLLERSKEVSHRLYLPIIPELKQKVKKVRIKTNDKKALQCWEIPAENKNKYVLFLHGASQNITHNQPIYKALSENGFGVFALEYRGHGKNRPAKTNENLLGRDVDAALNYLRKKVPDSDIAIVGHSLGAATAAKTASKHKNIGLVILLAPFNGLKSASGKFFNENKDYFPITFLRMIKKFPFTFSYIGNAYGIDKKISKINSPTYIIHSQNDRTILPQTAELLAKKRGDLSSLRLVPSGGHRLEDVKIEETINVLREKFLGFKTEA